MDRNNIFQAINIERDKQDKVWSDRTQYTRFAPHLLILEEKVLKMRSEWYKGNPEVLHDDFIKIAAIACRALEEVK